tara:strand:- start:565 stop:1089 length:525 start_codon:yes stop_codon:yes gene_type:complete
MNDIEIRDNLISSFDLSNLKNNILDSSFPWYRRYVINPKDKDSESMCSNSENYQLCHNFIGETSNSFPIRSEFVDYLNPIIKYINFISWQRIKANFLPSTSSIIKHGFHHDHDSENVKTSIFYLNTNNGYTEFEDGTKIESIENRLVTFPSILKHTGTTCTDSSFRVVINFNYF